MNRVATESPRHRVTKLCAEIERELRRITAESDLPETGPGMRRKSLGSTEPIVIAWRTASASGSKPLMARFMADKAASKRWALGGANPAAVAHRAEKPASDGREPDLGGGVLRVNKTSQGLLSRVTRRALPHFPTCDTVGGSGRFARHSLKDCPSTAKPLAHRRRRPSSKCTNAAGLPLQDLVRLSSATAPLPGRPRIPYALQLRTERDGNNA
jgi:hypothetical protein